MSLRHLRPLLLLLVPARSPAQAPTRPAPPAAFAALDHAVDRELSGAQARATVAFVEQFYRLPGNRGFDRSIDTVAALLRAAGYVDQATATPGDRFTYRIESRPMRQPAWSPLDASLTLAGRRQPLLTWSGNHNMLAANSWSTPAGGVRAPLVDVGEGREADFATRQVTGAIVIGGGNAGTLYQRAMAHGAIGVLQRQQLPAYNRQDVNVDAIRFSAVPLDTLHHGFLIFLSAAARDSLDAALARGPVEVSVMVRAVLEQRPERTVVAEIRGSRRPAERFVYSAHVQEPGANDNASGVGLLAEMARTAAVLVRGGQVDPARTITFLWGNEIQSTARFIAEDSVRRQGIRWGMSLDMVGENTALTGGTFLIEKMKDPSAVWVRGADQHTAWGGSPVQASEIWPHFLNAFSRQRCLDRAATTGWVVRANPYEGGSDHTPFLQAHIPAVLFWHFTDQYYHTDRDRLAMVSAATLANVGNCALDTGLLLATGGEAVARPTLHELARVAAAELAAQATLSREAIAAGGDPATERTILATWRDYYLAALPTVREILLDGDDLGPALGEAAATVRAAADRALAGLD